MSLRSLSALIGECPEIAAVRNIIERLLRRHSGTRRPPPVLIGYRGWVECSLGRAYLLLGRLEDAQRLAERAVDSTPSQPGFAAHARLLLGDIASRPERWDPARGEAHYRGLARAERLGMRPVSAPCHLGLGQLYRTTDRREPARDPLGMAAAMYREMQMTFWLRHAATAEPGPPAQELAVDARR